MDFYYSRADRLDIHHAGIVAEIFLYPLAAVFLNFRARLCQHDPVVEHPAAKGFTMGMAPPGDLARNDRCIARNMFPLQ